MLAHLVEIFIKDPLRVVPWTLRGLVSSMDVCLDSFTGLYGVLKVQMPKDIDVEDGLIYDVLRKSEGVSQGAQTTKGLVGKLGRSVDEMRSRGLTVELRHVGTVDGCYQQIKGLADCYRKVCLFPGKSDGRWYPNSLKSNCIQPRSTLKPSRIVSTNYRQSTTSTVPISLTASSKNSQPHQPI
jgi:hypothetical protein